MSQKEHWVWSLERWAQTLQTHSAQPSKFLQTKSILSDLARNRFGGPCPIPTAPRHGRGPLTMEGVPSSCRLVGQHPVKEHRLPLHPPHPPPWPGKHHRSARWSRAPLFFTISKAAQGQRHSLLPVVPSRRRYGSSPGTSTAPSELESPGNQRTRGVCTV